MKDYSIAYTTQGILNDILQAILSVFNKNYRAKELKFEKLYPDLFLFLNANQKEKTMDDKFKEIFRNNGVDL